MIYKRGPLTLAQRVALFHAREQRLERQDSEALDTDPIAFPAGLLVGQAAAYDPYDLAKQFTSRTADTGAVTAGSLVGRLYPQLGTDLNSLDGRLGNNSDTARPTLTLLDGRLGWVFDGTNDFLDGSTVGWDLATTKKATIAAMVRTSDAFAGTPFSAGGFGAADQHQRVTCFVRNGAAISSFGRLGSNAAGTSLVPSFVEGTSYALASGLTATPTWRLWWWDIEVDAFNSPTGGRLRLSIDGVLSTEIVIDTTIGSDDVATEWNRFTIGCRYFNTRGQFFAGAVGRTVRASQTFESAQRAYLERWLRGTELV